MTGESVDAELAPGLSLGPKGTVHSWLRLFSRANSVDNSDNMYGDSASIHNDHRP